MAENYFYTDYDWWYCLKDGPLPLSILQLDPADRAVLRIAGNVILLLINYVIMSSEHQVTWLDGQTRALAAWMGG